MNRQSFFIWFSFQRTQMEIYEQKSITKSWLKLWLNNIS